MWDVGNLVSKNINNFKNIQRYCFTLFLNMSKMFTVQLYDLPRGVQKKFLSGIVSNFNFPPEQTKSFDFFPGLTLTEVYSRYRANLQTAHFKIWQNETVHRMRYPFSDFIIVRCFFYTGCPTKHDSW